MPDTTTPEATRVRFSHAGGTARLTLVRPGAGNAIDTAFVHDAGRAVDQLGATPGIRVLRIDAEGPNFCVGGDLVHLTEGVDRLPDLLDEMIGVWHGDVLPRLQELPVPVVTVVQGAVAGGGLGLVWAADVVLAADDARFVTGFDKLGLSGDGGSSWHLPRLVGDRRAREVLLAGRGLDAATALDWGVVTQVVPGDDLSAAADRVVAQLAAGSTPALGLMRDLLRHSRSRTHREHLLAEKAAMRACAEQGDVREGMAAFLERRRPDFRGPAAVAGEGAR